MLRAPLHPHAAALPQLSVEHLQRVPNDRRPSIEDTRSMAKLHRRDRLGVEALQLGVGPKELGRVEDVRHEGHAVAGGEQLPNELPHLPAR